MGLKLAFGLIVAILLASPLRASAEDFNRGFSIEVYEALSVRQPYIGVDPRASTYLDGIMIGLHAAKQEYVKAGQAPLFCTSSDFRVVDLYEQMADELAAEGHTWRRASDATASRLALYVMRRHYPCAASADTSGKLWEDMSVFGFRLLIMRANAGDQEAIGSIMILFTGMREGMMAASDAHVAGGARRQICIPPDVETVELIHAIDEDIDRNFAHWDDHPDEPVASVALQVFARKWPCP